MLKAIIVDDEQHCIDRVQTLLQNYSAQIQLVSSCTTKESGVNAIASLQPDIVFMDVHLKEYTGFDVLRALENNHSFELVFTTAYDSYALDAFKFSAMDYLLKPVDKVEFEQTILRILKKRNSVDTPKKLEVLFNNFEETIGKSKKIAIPTQEGLDLILVEDIIRLQSDGNYTHIFLKGKGKITATKTLKYFEVILEKHQFFRAHKSHFININDIDKYVKGKGGYVILSDGTHIEVAIRRKDELLKKIMG